MEFKLENVTPFGRSYEEYINMFDLKDDLDKKILGIADGPAAFNAHMHQQGKQVISCDPIYQFNVDELRVQIEKHFKVVVEQMHKNSAMFAFKHFKTVQEMADGRYEAMQVFLHDYAQAEQGRYIHAKLPNLPFEDKYFDLSICSHFLLLYAEHLDFNFHTEAIEELLRVSKEVRIFPITNLNATRSKHVEPLIAFFDKKGYSVTIKKVDYESQKGSDQMLIITAC